MSEHTEEIRDAAAAGAAAAVDAVVTEQTEQERADAVANATAIAGMSAEQAEQEANAAAEAATEAATVASEAHAEATSAEATAEQAAEQAEQASGEVGQLRDFMMAGFSEMRKFITDALTPKPPSDEPTEVVVDGTSRADTGETRSNPGSGGSASGDERAYRHRFGRRIT